MDTPDKDHLRLAIRADRESESHAVQVTRSVRLAAHAGELVAWAQPAVAAYLPTNAEPDIGPLVRSLSVPVYLPRVVGSALEWVAAAPGDIVGMRRGIPHPEGPAAARGAELADVLGVRVLLVPALAIDPANGTRLGYGAGFYDRFLSQVRRRPGTRVLAVGVCRDLDLTRLPRKSHDQPLDAALTEAGLTWIAGRAPTA